MSWADLGTLVTVRRRREELKQGISKIVVCLCLGASLIIRQPSRALHPGESCIFLHDNRFKSADAPQPIMKKMDRENRCKHVQLPFTPLSCSSHTVQVITRSMHFCCSKLPKHFHSLVMQHHGWVRVFAQPCNKIESAPDLQSHWLQMSSNGMQPKQPHSLYKGHQCQSS